MTSFREKTVCPVLKSSAIRQGFVDFTALNYFSECYGAREEELLSNGDVLFARLSGSIEYVGCCAVVADLPEGGLLYPDRVFRARLPSGSTWLGAYVVLWLRSTATRKWIERAAKSTAGHKRISLSDLRKLQILLPPDDEVGEILATVQETFRGIDGAEKVAASLLRQAAAQRQNILKSAFSGQLVPQDPSDEPASVLLGRIRAERAARPATKATRGRKAKATA